MRTLPLPPLNPVLARELKQRMRGRLTWLVVTGYLAVLALILRFVYLGASQTISGDQFGDPLASASVGRSIFHWLLFFMLMLVCFIVPGLTASAISGERERQTLVSLQVTLLRPRSIVVGKLLSSLAFTSFLVVASLPLLSVPFLVGGVSVSEVAKGVAMILLTAVVLACLSVACSALLRRTQAATVIAYGLTAALTVGTFIVYGGQRAMDGPVNKASPAILALNPFVATADVVQGRSESTSFDSPFTALVDLVRPDVSGDFAPDSGFGIAPAGGIAIQNKLAQVAGVQATIAVGPVRAPFPAPVPTPPPTIIGTGIPDAGVAYKMPDGSVITLDPSTSATASSSSSSGSASGSTGDSLTVTSDDPVIGGPAVDLPAGPIIFDGTGGFQITDGAFQTPRAEVAGLHLWVAWLLASVVLGGLALVVAVRRVSLPSARDGS